MGKKIIIKMNTLISAYKSVGKGVKSHMSRRANFILQGAEPVIWQTPGRVQYFRAENEPFIPGKSAAPLITFAR
jgi:hypothetical protein